MTANVDFSSRSIAFSTSNTSLANTNSGVQSSNSGLNINGTLAWNPTVNGFSGVVNTANGQLNGGANGSFFGPAAEEIGGVYQLQNVQGGPAVNKMIGAFGGKR
jgi:hypothetical protein